MSGRVVLGLAFLVGSIPAADVSAAEAKSVFKSSNLKLGTMLSPGLTLRKPPTMPTTPPNLSGNTKPKMYMAPNRPGTSTTQGWDGWKLGGTDWNVPSGRGLTPGFTPQSPSYQPEFSTIPADASAAGLSPPVASTQALAGKTRAIAAAPPRNELKFQARTITAGEIAAARRFFSEHFAEAVAELERQLSEPPASPAQLVSSKPRSISPQAQSSIREALAALRLKAQSLTLDDVQAARNALKTSLDPAEAKTALASLDRLATKVKIHDAVNAAAVGQGNATPLAIAGSRALIWNPKLPARTAVTLGDGPLMVGTGGAGELDLAEGSVAAAMGLPVDAGIAVPPRTDAETPDGVRIVNPPSTGTTAYYRINGREFAMAPGQQQDLPATSAWTIDFHRGGDFGRQTYSLSPQSYQFTPTEQGWELYGMTYSVTIDNRANPRPFHYVVQGEPASAPAKSSKTHESPHPLVLRFDRGNGAVVKQVHAEKGALKVAINGTDGLWDLYVPGESPALAPDFVPSF